MRSVCSQLTSSSLRCGRFLNGLCGMSNVLSNRRRPAVRRTPLCWQSRRRGRRRPGGIVAIGRVENAVSHDGRDSKGKRAHPRLKIGETSPAVRGWGVANSTVEALHAARAVETTGSKPNWHHSEKAEGGCVVGTVATKRGVASAVTGWGEPVCAALVPKCDARSASSTQTLLKSASSTSGICS